MAQLEWTTYNAADTAVAGAGLNALGNAGYALGAAIDNSAGLWTDADLLIVLSSGITTAATQGANVGVWLIPSVDGTHYPETGGGTSAGTTAANLQVGAIVVPVSTNVQTMVLRGIALPPARFLIQIQNNTGTAFPATTTSVCSLYRYRLQSV